MGILIFLLAAAIYDWKYRFIPGWLYVAAAIEAVLWRGICQIGKEGIWEELVSYCFLFLKRAMVR